jgi:hypothetical protein
MLAGTGPGGPLPFLVSTRKVRKTNDPKTLPFGFPKKASTKREMK